MFVTKPEALQLFEENGMLMVLFLDGQLGCSLRAE